MSDLIERQDAIDAINSWFEKAKHPMNRGAYNNGEVAAYSTAISEIENLPSAEPERKQGKWIYNSPVTMKCNQCGLVIKDWDWHRFNYCPNCGARMDGEQNGIR